MAVIRIYGESGCPRVSEAAAFLNNHGAAVECHELSEAVLPASVLARAASLNQSAGFPAEAAGALSDADGAELPDNSGSISGFPLVVRGSRVIVATDPASLSSLMY